ncbi:MAG TPA: DUF1549 and DUF1553 domain-containing protein [Bryobacteraceae bacterium]|nr:DUF1549 and DUF1553 domain-containing protein [Bryobacteraceae bacterium]
MRFHLRWPASLFVLSCLALTAPAAKKSSPVRKPVATPAAAPASGPVVPVNTATPESRLWVLRPVVRPEVPAGVTNSTNPIDAFVAADYKAKGIVPVGQADKQTLLRRVYIDLIGIPPTPEQQDAFLQDQSPDAYEKVVDTLLASEQYGVRYARHWLDVLRYADVDERMIAAPGIYLWRDWVIRALNDDMPYDQFTRAQLTGYRSSERTTMTATGYRQKLEPRPADLFARGFLSRGDVLRDGKEVQELPITAVETVSTAFMGLTVGCAKCHDHMYDPIKQKDFYAMKALFDPLVLRKLTLGTPEQIFAAGKAQDEAEKSRAPVQAKIDALVEPVRNKLYADRLAMLPVEVQLVIKKAEKDRTPAEQKIADDYFPVLRIDSGKIEEVMAPDQVQQYKALQQELACAGGGGRRGGGGAAAIPAFWTVEADPKKETEPSYILTSGDPDRPEKNHEVKPGWPFAPQNIDWREGRVEAFSDWLTARNNPMFSRVAVNRLWQWHFGEGIQKNPSDFGKLGGLPSDQNLLDWLASEFVSRGFSMKQMTRLMVTSETYKLASDADPKVMATSMKADPADTYLWHFRLQRLEAESVWDSILSAAGELDTSVGGASFDPAPASSPNSPNSPNSPKSPNRRAAYMIRGFTPSRDVMPNFLQAFDVDDGRLPCPLRTQTVTAPQGLFMMNSDEIEKASAKFAERLTKESGGDLNTALDLAYRIAFSRPPSANEKDRALTYLDNDPARLKGLTWLLFNLDEFIYLR